MTDEHYIEQAPEQAAEPHPLFLPTPPDDPPEWDMNLEGEAEDDYWKLVEVNPGEFEPTWLSADDGVFDSPRAVRDHVLGCYEPSDNDIYRAAMLIVSRRAWMVWTRWDSERAMAIGWNLERHGDGYRATITSPGVFDTIDDLTEHLEDALEDDIEYYGEAGIYVKARRLLSAQHDQPANATNEAPQTAAEPEAAAAGIAQPEIAVVDGDVFIVNLNRYLRHFQNGTFVQAAPQTNGNVRLTGIIPWDCGCADVSLDQLKADISARKILPADRYFDPATPVRRLLCVSSFSFGSSSSSIGYGSMLTINAEHYLTLWPDGAHVAGLRNFPRVMRVLSHFMIPIGDNGFPINPDHLTQFASMMPRRRCLPRTIMIAVERAPASPITEVMIRNYLKVPPPADAKTTEAIMAWLENVPPFGAIEPAPAPALLDPLPQQDIEVTPAVQRVAEPSEPSVEYDFTIDELRSGTTRFTQTDTIAGTMQIPVSVIARGNNAVRRYIREHFDDEDVDFDRTEGTRSVEFSDDDESSVDELRVESTVDCDDLMERARELHPELFDDDGDYTG